jgi:hypothetical protein
MLKHASLAVLFIVLAPQTVQAFDHHHHHHHHSSGDGSGCGGSSEPELASGDVAPTPTPTRGRVFVTSTTYSGALGGPTGADAACDVRAAAAGLTGVFRAWLSEGTAGAYDRAPDSGPWYTTGDAIAFTGKIDLRGAPRAELLDEYGGHVDPVGAWSGSNTEGAATGNDCVGWTTAAIEETGTAGTALRLDASWAGGDAPRTCNVAAPIICFQQ